MEKLDINVEMIERNKKKEIQILDKENSENGSYEEWYDSLKNFRTEVKQKYIKYQSIFRTFKYKPTQLQYGHFLDYHIYSCLAPLDFKRNGWGKTTAPWMQVKILSDFFQNKKVRFIYVPLPNKSAIYPELISECNFSCTSCIPQWRKYIRLLIEGGIECVDVFPVFDEISKRELNWNGSITDSEKLFSRGHHISGTGAYIVGKELAEYLKLTTGGLEEKIKLRGVTEVYNITGNLKEKLYLCLYKNKNGVDVPYYNQIKSSIAVFGDCNLQRNEMCGANISANLARELGFPIENMGRKLVFSKYDGIDTETLLYLTTKDIVIYIAFASASFVRTSQFYWRTFGRPLGWNDLVL